VLGVAAQAHAAPRGCDPLDPAHCLLPWPNDHFRKDGRLALTNAMMPHSGDGKPIQASDYNRSDGFSPGCGVLGAPACLGTPPAPIVNQPPRVGVNPHAITLIEGSAIEQFMSFLAPKREVRQQLRGASMLCGGLDRALTG
jgi:hypothetical protein